MQYKFDWEVNSSIVRDSQNIWSITFYLIIWWFSSKYSWIKRGERIFIVLPKVDSPVANGGHVNCACTCLDDVVKIWKITVTKHTLNENMDLADKSSDIQGILEIHSYYCLLQMKWLNLCLELFSLVRTELVCFKCWFSAPKKFSMNTRRHWFKEYVNSLSNALYGFLYFAKNMCSVWAINIST